MLRSLHMKLVMIMILLILSLMTVVGAFLINSVMAFYLEDFYTQMQSVFEQEELVSDLRTQAEGEEDGGQQIFEALSAYSGQLGVDGYNRKLYVLDGTGQYLAGSDGRDGQVPEYTHNLMMVLSGESEVDRKSTRLNSSHTTVSRMPSSA